MVRCLILVAAFSCVIAVCFGCSCIVPDKQDQFCDADFVWKVRINCNLTNTNPQTFNSYYNVLFITSYKRNDVPGLSYHDRLFKIYTASQSAACGVTWLQRNTEYVISGKIVGGQLRLNSCTSLVFKVASPDQFLNKILAGQVNCYYK